MDWRKRAAGRAGTVAKYSSIAEVPRHLVAVQRTDIAERPAKRQRLAADAGEWRARHLNARARPTEWIDLRGHVVDRDTAAAAPAAAVIVGNRDADRIVVGGGTAGAVVQILMTGAEAEHARGQFKRRRPLTRPPADDHGVRILRARIDDRAGERDRAILGGPFRRDAQPADRRCDVVDRHAGAAAGAIARRLGHCGADGVHIGGSAGGIIVGINVAERERGDAGRQVERRCAFARAPVDDDRMRIGSIGIGERAGECCDPVLADRGIQIERHVGRGSIHLVDRHDQGIAGVLTGAQRVEGIAWFELFHRDLNDVDATHGEGVAQGEGLVRVEGQRLHAAAVTVVHGRDPEISAGVGEEARAGERAPLVNGDVRPGIHRWQYVVYGDRETIRACAPLVIAYRDRHEILAVVRVGVIQRERLIRVQSQRLNARAVAVIHGSCPGIGIRVGEGAGAGERITLINRRVRPGVDRWRGIAGGIHDLGHERVLAPSAGLAREGAGG